MTSGSALGVDVEGKGHTAHQPVGMRILASEYCVDFDHVPLKIKCLDIVRHEHEIRFGGQSVVGMSPVAVFEDAEMAGFGKPDQFVAYAGEIAGGRLGPGGQALGQMRCFDGIALGAESTSIQSSPQADRSARDDHGTTGASCIRLRMQLALSGISMPRASSTGLNGGQRMRAGADAADALGECPDITRVPVFHDDFEAAEHGAAGYRVGDHVVVVDVHLTAQMPFNAGDGVDDDPRPVSFTV